MRAITMAALIGLGVSAGAGGRASAGERAVASAQGRRQPLPPGPPGPPPPPPGAGAVRKQVNERIRMMRMWKLTEALSLDEATAQRFFPILNKFDEKVAPLHRQQGEIIMRLRAEIESGRPDPVRLSKGIDDLLGLRKQVAALEDERIREVRRVLSPTQQAKLVLLLPKIERELRRSVRRAMNLPPEED